VAAAVALLVELSVTREDHRGTTVGKVGRRVLVLVADCTSVAISSI
jgi:hypothetical protein